MSFAGFIVPNLELPPLCHPRFKPGPPSEQAQVASQFLLEVINNSSLLDRRSLCIRPGRLAWVVCIDLVCHNYDGSVIDVAVKAMVRDGKGRIIIVVHSVSSTSVTILVSFFFKVAGLRTVQVPTVVLEDDDEEVMDTSEESTQTMAEEGGDIDSLKKRLKVFSKRRTRLALGPQPVSCTVAIFEGRSLLLDPTDEEEALCSALITVVLAQNHDAATEEGEEESVVHFRKAGGSPVSQNFMAECMALAKKQAKKIRKILEKAAPLEGM